MRSYLFLKTTFLQRESFPTMFYTINSSPKLVTKWVFELTFVLSNYQECTFPLTKGQLHQNSYWLRLPKCTKAMYSSCSFVLFYCCKSKSKPNSWIQVGFRQSSFWVLYEYCYKSKLSTWIFFCWNSISDVSWTLGGLNNFIWFNNAERCVDAVISS